MSRASEARMIRQRVQQTLQASQQQIHAQRVNYQVMQARQQHLQHLQSLPQGYAQVQYTPEQIAYYQQQAGAPMPPPPPPVPSEDQEEAKIRKNLVPTKHNSQYNMNTLLASNILRSDYFRALYEKNTFQQVVDEIYYQVDHAEPWMNPASRKPSTAFCLLYKFFTMKLTIKQMHTLLNHRDSPFIRAIGFLYLRYTCPPAELWSWCEPYVHDKEEFSPQRGSTRKTTIGRWLSQLLGSDLKYYGTLLPRIPKQIETTTQVKLLRSKNEPELSGASRDGEYAKGTVVRARYSEDGKWYDARIEEPGKKPGFYWVTYLPEDEYGNQEEVPLKSIKPIRTTSKRPRETDEELRRRVLERERNSVATSGRDFAKPIPGIKSSLAVPIIKRHKTEDAAPTGSQKSIEDVLKEQGRIGDIESKKLDSKASAQREKLLARYGNAGASSSQMKEEHKG